MLRTLKHYKAVTAAVVLGAAVATAVLTGALVVGDSVRGSLRQITLERLGAIDHALVSEHFFRAELATDLALGLAVEPAVKRAAVVVPATLLSGTAVHAQTRARATQVQIVGADPALASMLGGQGLDFTDPAGAVFPAAIINRSLQQQLGIQVGDDFIISFERETAVPRESLFGRRASGDVVQRLRLSLRGVVEDRGLGRFGLRPHQAQPLNVFLALSDLQTALERPGRANTLLVAAGPELTLTIAELAQALQAALTLEDFELSIRVSADAASLESRRFLLSRATAAAAGRTAIAMKVPHAAIFTYMANEISAADKAVPYSTVTALDPTVLNLTGRPADAGLGQLTLIDGSSAPALDDGAILVNEWLAEDLGVVAGDSLTLSYYTVGAGEELDTRHSRFRVRGVTAMQGLGSDQRLTPDYPGIHGAVGMADWSAPFPVDLTRVRERDEDYWEKYGATPKAFIGQAAGVRLWGNRFGEMTAMRMAPAPTQTLAATVAAFERSLLKQLRAPEAGFVFQPVRDQGLRAAAGATDFSMLFIGFSMFIIAAALLLVILLFRLGVEQRVRELGLLLALGFPLRAVRRRFLLEGITLALVGGIIGMAGAVGYAWAMLAGLRYLWQDAVGTPDLQLHVETDSLAVGLVLSVAIVGASIAVAVRRYARLPVRSLLAGVSAEFSAVASRTHGRRLTIIFALGAGVALFLARDANSSSATGLFFVSGAALLCCGLSACSCWLKRRTFTESATLGRVGLRMGLRNVRRQPGRSMVCVSLVACACFVIVAVGASGREFGEQDEEERSTTGGFTLLAEADISLFQSLGSRAGREQLGLSSLAESALSQTQVFAFRSRAGEDASCLNLYRPERPRLLGVPAELIDRGGFRFVDVESSPQVEAAADNPWSLLNLDLGRGTIPVFGDFNSVRWILHLDLGDRLVLSADTSSEVELRLVGLLDRSVFQSELLMSAENFERYFPMETGYGFFAFDVAPDTDAQQLAADLERDLEGYGFDVMGAGERAARFQAVENTYLSTFQSLGGLGLILGTIGLAVVSLRNAMERKGELAVQRAFGFTRRRLYRMLLTETGVLLMVGVALGAGCALVAVLPHLGSLSTVPWRSLTATLGLVLAVGMTSAAVAALLALRAPLLPALKSA